MSLPKLDPSLWNLSLPVGLLLNSACGPKVPFEEDTDGTDTGTGTGWTETDTVPGTWSTSSPDTTLSDTASTGVSECNYDSDCPPYYYCAGGRCYYEGCLDGCCNEFGGSCYYDCYAHEECGTGAFCYYGSCNSAYYVGSCGVELAVIPLPEGAGAGALSLAFVDADANGDAELVQGRANGFEVDFVGGAPIVRSLTGVQPASIAIADFTNDGIVDLAFADEAAGRVTMTRGLGNGSFQFLGNTPGDNNNAAIGGDFNADGLADIVTTDVDGNGRIFVGDGEGGFADNADVPFTASSFAGTTIDGDGTYDLVFQDGAGPHVYFGNPNLGSADAYLTDTSTSSTRILTAKDDGVFGSTQVAGIISATGVVFPWTKSDGVPQRGVPGYVPGIYEHIALGDVDGEGISDIVLAGPDGVTVVFMSDGFPSCIVQAFVSHSVDALAVGDIDSDGRSEIAVANASSTTVLTAVF